MTRRATIALLAVTLLWGGTFIWMKQALNAAAHHDVGENDVVSFFLFMRFAIAALLLPLVYARARGGLRSKEVWKGGAWLGLIIWGGFALQMFALTDITPAVSAFLTSLYVVFTALIGVALGRPPLSKYAIAGVLLATFGAGWISGPPQLHFGMAEWITIGCAFLFGAHIIATDRITKEVDPVEVTTTMLLSVTALCGILLLFSKTAFTDLFALLTDMDFLIPLLCCGTLGSLVALLVLNMYQREVTPVRAAILYALEPVWALLASLALGLEGSITMWLPIGAGALLIGNLVVEFDALKPSNDAETVD